MSTWSTDRLFAEYRQCCLDRIAQHGPATGRICRCGRLRPCREEMQWVLMLEMVLGGAA